MAEFKNKKSIPIVGREEEKTILQEALSSGESEFVAIYGRRRVGKTFLIKQVYQKELIFSFTGAIDLSLAEQLHSFYTTLCQYQKPKKNQTTPTTWMEAFHMLQSYIRKKKVNRKKVIFLDEVPWIASQRSGFLTALDYFWNSYAAWTRDIVLVICGSAASWIINNVVRNRGGLHNRLTKRIRLLPFTLPETKIFLKTNGITYTDYQLLQLYMVTGGVPHYLKVINGKLSVAQNIQQLCFTKDGLLATEFDSLYKALFKNGHKHIAVVEALAKKNKGLSRSEILKLTKWSSGGTLTTILNELIESGFVETLPPYDKQYRETIYRLIDEYSLFYVKYIQAGIPKVKDVWLHISNSPSYKSWAGFAFENICLKHIPQITKALGIQGVGIYAASFLHKGTQEQKGIQIDLVLERDDGLIHLFEIKFAHNTYTITKEYDAQLRQKCYLFQQYTGTRKGIVRTMLTTYGVTPNMYYHNVPFHLTAEILFHR
jgi:uncharacterized protein